jgi:hypothetical protein
VSSSLHRPLLTRHRTHTRRKLCTQQDSNTRIQQSGVFKRKGTGIGDGPIPSPRLKIHYMSQFIISTIITVITMIFRKLKFGHFWSVLAKLFKPCSWRPCGILSINNSVCLLLPFVQGGSNMTGTNCDLFTHNQSLSYLNHLVFTPKYFYFNLLLSATHIPLAHVSVSPRMNTSCGTLGESG